MTGTKGELLAQIEARASNGVQGMIISDSVDEHFDIIVEAMDALNASRHGSQVVALGGRRYIVDKYILPNGKTILAGYAQ